MFSHYTFFALFTITLAAPTHKYSRATGVENVVPTSTCKSTLNALLTPKAGTGAFAIKNNTLTFDSAAQGKGLPVQFQPCDPNFGGYNNTDKVSVGHVYVPSVDQCLLVEDVKNSKPGVLTGPCESPDDSRQILLTWMHKDGQVFWSGETKADGTQFQGAPTCKTGIYGYRGDKTGAPPTGPVILGCSGGAENVFGLVLSQ